ncbi:CLL_collapsed_G0029410.mRNA.1.CDS.1 [Saccharomyces cerevisiae]|nr:CLL_collapsed_G0029410.mRNA.1.CDS.1 [Saccharomyces cerevisiae]
MVQRDNEPNINQQLVHSQKSLQQDLSNLKSELTRIEAETIKVDKKSQNEWDELRKMLEIDSKIIKECNEELLQVSQNLLLKLNE